MNIDDDDDEIHSWN